MIVVATGSRSWPESRRHIIHERLILLPTEVLVIQGGAPGVDRMVKEECKTMLIDCETMRANWRVYHGGAGHIRNGEMLDRNPEFVMGFWDMVSSGTKECLQEADRRGIKWEFTTPSGDYYDSDWYSL